MENQGVPRQAVDQAGSEILERSCGDEESRILKALISDALHKNELLPENSHCKKVGSEFKIDLLEGVTPVYTRQYPIPQAHHPLVMKRIEE